MQTQLLNQFGLFVLIVGNVLTIISLLALMLTFLRWLWNPESVSVQKQLARTVASLAWAQGRRETDAGNHQGAARLYEHAASLLRSVGILKEADEIDRALGEIYLAMGHTSVEAEALSDASEYFDQAMFAFARADDKSGQRRALQGYALVVRPELKSMAEERYPGLMALLLRMNEARGRPFDENAFLQAQLEQAREDLARQIDRQPSRRRLQLLRAVILVAVLLSIVADIWVYGVIHVPLPSFLR